MYTPTRYLGWARRFYGQVRFDLATSGIATLPHGELLGLVSEAQPPDDPAAAWSGLRGRIAAHNDVTVDEVMPALGTTHAIWLACAALLAPGDDVLVEGPAYEPLHPDRRGHGARGWCRSSATGGAATRSIREASPRR